VNKASSKESLGVVSCEGCNGDAHIKRRSNGKKLLYLHCKSCGLDQRSGKVLQAKWQAAINGDASASPELEQTNPKSNEWHPAEESDNEESNKDKADNNDSRTSNFGIKCLAGIGIGLAVIFGLKAG